MGPVGNQTFDLSRGQDQEYCECNPLIMNRPILGTNYSPTGKYDFTRVGIYGMGKDLKVKVKGPALPFGRFTFKNCEEFYN